MNNIDILKATGVIPEFYIITENEWEMIPKTSNNRFIMCKLPRIFTHYDQNNNSKYPEENNFYTAVYEDIEEALYEQAEKHLLVRPNAEDMKLIYDMKISQRGLLKDFEGYKDKIVKGFPQYVPLNLKDDTLGFESRFECGNLAYAFKTDKKDYELFLNNDVSSEKHSSWFFFQIYNTRAKKEYKFTINNFGGSVQLYTSGMQLVMYSLKLDKFLRVGTKIAHYHNFIKKKNNSNYNALTFSIEFPCNYDSVYLSLGYPYTYSRALSLCKYIFDTSAHNKLIINKKLCNTINGNEARYMIITSDDLNSDKKIVKKERLLGQTSIKANTITLDKLAVAENTYSFGSNRNLTNFTEAEMNILRKKQIYIIGARVHPAEFPSSFVIEELILNLISDSDDAEKLRSQIAFVIVPMINIDGVIAGNSRCEVSGVDLNRVWNEPSKILHPTIFYYKRLIKNLINEGLDVSFFLDIHAHSKKFNAFIYSNPILENKNNTFLHYMQEYSDAFSFDDSTFTVQKTKEKSARVVIWKEFNIENSFTLEISYVGPNKGAWAFQQHHHFIFKNIGDALFKSMIALINTQNLNSEKNSASDSRMHPMSLRLPN